MSAIKIDNLSFVYSKRSPFEKLALDDVSFEIEEGEFVGIIGETGSGKSTLVQHLNGLVKAQNGKVEILGKDATEKKNLKNLRFEVGMVFQYPEYQLFEETVAKDVAFGPKNMKLPAEEIDRRVNKAMVVVGLPYADFAERSPFELSGGEKRRAAIAGVIAMEPKILVLDEPFAGLDPVGVREITELILKLKKEISPTVVLVSHSMDAAAELCDRLIVLSDGKLVGNGTPKQIFVNRSLISAAGLDLPFAAKLCDALSASGIEMPGDIVSEKELIQKLAEMKNGGVGDSFDEDETVQDDASDAIISDGFDAFDGFDNGDSDDNDGGKFDV